MAIEDRPVTTADYPSLEKLFDTVLKEKQKFERLIVPKETLLEMFAVRINCVCNVQQSDSFVMYSTTNTRSSLLNRRYPTEPLQLYTAAGL